MITANHKHYETLVQNLEQMSNLTEDDFKEFSNRYYARAVMHDAKLAIEELDAYKNSLNLYFVVYSKHEGKEWSGYAGYIFAKRKEDIEELLKIQCDADVTIRSIESIDIQDGSVLCGRRWISADGKL